MANASGYTVAGMETLATIVDNFIKNKRGDFNNNFTRDDISNFFENVCNRFLHSYGQNFKGKKKYTTYNQNEANLFSRCKSFGFYEKSEMIADSGAFQISIGVLSKEESILLFDNFYNFLKDFSHVIDQAFILDLPPGPGCKLFSNFDEVYNENLRSYTYAANLPDDVRKKVVYIHHFRTPKLWEIYNKILKENEFYNYFDKFATGGIVANSSGDSQIPCIIYVLPLIPLINETIKNGRDVLHFHILGGATYRDLFFYELFKIHVKKIHNVDLKITYDSSGLFKGLMIGRVFNVIHNNTIKKVDIRSDFLNQTFDYELNLKNFDVCKNVCNFLSQKYNFTEIDFSRDGTLYNPKTGTFYEDFKVYLMLYMLEFYLEVENLMKSEVSRIYPLYENNIEIFIDECEQITRRINQGKITKKQISKTNSIVRTLKMLETLDENECEYIIKKYLSKDEFIDLTDEGQILTF